MDRTNTTLMGALAGFATIAIAATPAGAEVMRTTAGTFGGRGNLALGVMGGYGAAGLPEAGINLHLNSNGPVNFHAAPRMTLGPAPEYFVPVTLRPFEILDVPSLYVGAGPFMNLVGGTAGVGALAEAGIRTPVSGPIEFEVGLEGGYELAPILKPTWNITAGILYRI